MRRIISIKKVTHQPEVMRAPSSTTNRLASLFDAQTELHIIVHK